MTGPAAAMPLQVQLQEAFKLALSLTLFYWLALWMDWDLPKFGAMTIVVVSLATTGASLNKGVMRVAGTGLGAVAGFALLHWFAQSPHGMLLGVSLYLVVIGYLMQTSRQGDTWYNAGFIAVAVWSSSYMKVDTAFHFATARFQETAAGVIIFTLVSVLFWPRTSGGALREQGEALWQELRRLFGLYREQLQAGTRVEDAAQLNSELVGAYHKMAGTLEAAYADTPVVRRNRKVWELLRVDLLAMGNAQELWRESIDDCRRLDLATLLPGLDRALATLDARLARGTELWQLQQSGGEDDAEGDDSILLGELDLAVDTTAESGLSHIQRGALLNFIEQLKILDRNSSELLRTLRVLAGLDPASRLHGHAPKAEPFRPLRWNPERLLKALFPTACWITAWLFWNQVQPPGGPSIPLMGAAFGLVMVMAPMNLLGLLLVLLLCMFVIVAPVYMFIMPLLDSGFAILALIFAYSFCFGFLGARSPVLKLGPLVMFVMMVDIQNEQVYSFLKLATGGLVILLGVGIVVLVHRLLSPMHPEQVLLRGLKQFFGGCEALIRGYAGVTRGRRGTDRLRRKRLFESRIVPLPARLQAAAGNLDYARFPENSADKVQGLLQGVYSLRNRLQALETGFNRTASETPDLLHEITPLHNDWLRRAGAVFDKWKRLEPADSLVASWGGQQQLVQELEQRLDELQRAHDINAGSVAGVQNLYALIGIARGVLDAMQVVQEHMRAINWQQLAAGRF